MKLKTLKDFKLYDIGDDNEDWVRHELIKAEAIKWVKEDIEELICDNPIKTRELIEKWIKRLNITKEDLK